MEPLYDVNLQLLADEQLIGLWRVAGRMLSQTDAVGLLGQAKGLQISGEHLLLVESDDFSEAVEGTWMIRRDSLLNRPYVELELPDGPTRALITRLRCALSGNPRQLTLYFQSGMELLLDCG